MPKQKQHTVFLMSFGFKHAPPPLEANFLFDARCLPNPFWEEPLKPYTGLDPIIHNYFNQFHEVQALAQGLEDSIALWLTPFEHSVTESITIAIGCTGGQHRSVYLAETLAKQLKKRLPEEFTIQVRHRDQDRWAT